MPNEDRNLKLLILLHVPIASVTFLQFGSSSEFYELRDQVYDRVYLTTCEFESFEPRLQLVVSLVQANRLASTRCMREVI